MSKAASFTTTSNLDNKNKKKTLRATMLTTTEIETATPS
jgi:hypothetical protein